MGGVEVGAVLDDEPDVVVVLTPRPVGGVGTSVVVVEDWVPFGPLVVAVVDEEDDEVDDDVEGVGR